MTVPFLPDAPSKTGLLALAQAEKFIGVTESPPFSNRGEDIDRWNRNAGVPAGSYWCMSFLYSCLKVMGANVPKTASVGMFLNWARANGFVVRRPRKGDIVCFFFTNPTRSEWPDHVGIVRRVVGIRWRGKRFVGWVDTVEGNTSGDDRGSQSNGGGVFRRRRHIVHAEFVRVP